MKILVWYIDIYDHGKGGRSTFVNDGLTLT